MARSLATRSHRQPRQQRTTPSPSAATAASSQLQGATRRVTRSMARGRRRSDSSNAPSNTPVTFMASQPSANDQQPVDSPTPEEKHADSDESQQETPSIFAADAPKEQEKAACDATNSGLKWTRLTDDELSICQDETAKEEIRTWGRPFEFKSQNDRWCHENYWGDGMSIDVAKAYWSDMTREVAHFTNRMAGPFLFSDLSSSMQNKLTDFFPQAKEYAVPRSFSFLAQLIHGLVWRTIWKHQLSPQCLDKWQGPEWEAYGRLRNTFKASLTDSASSLHATYYAWRHYTTRQLYVNHGRHSSAERLQDLLWDDLKELYETKLREPEVTKDLFKRFAEHVVEWDFWLESTKFIVQLVFENEETCHAPTSSLPEPYRSCGASVGLLTRSSVVQAMTQSPQNTLDGSQGDMITCPIFKFHGVPVSSDDPTFGWKHNNERHMKRYDICSYTGPAEFLPFWKPNSGGPSIPDKGSKE